MGNHNNLAGDGQRHRSRERHRRDHARLDANGGGHRRQRRPGTSRVEAAILTVGLVASVVSGVLAYRWWGPYGEGLDVDPRVHRVYDPSGRLVLIALDVSGDLVTDQWTYMDGDRVVRNEVDEDQDGRIDRREHFGADQQLERVEFFGAGERPTRTDYYEGGVVVRSEHAGDRDDDGAGAAIDQR